MSDNPEEFYLTVFGACLTYNERQHLRWLAEETVRAFGPRPTIVNIGVLSGASMWCLRVGAPEARLVGVDICIDRGGMWTTYRPDLLKAEMIETDSRTCRFDSFIHLLFIDGNHKEEFVRADIRNWAPRILPGGIISFHDFAPAPDSLAKYPEIDGVRRAVEALILPYPDIWQEVARADSIISFRRLAVEKKPALPWRR